MTPCEAWARSAKTKLTDAERATVDEIVELFNRGDAFNGGVVVLTLPPVRARVAYAVVKCAFESNWIAQAQAQNGAFSTAQQLIERDEPASWVLVLTPRWRE